MASSESQALSDLYKGWVAVLAANPDWPIEKVRAVFEHWGDVTGEPGEVDYVEVDAGGVPALWAIPKGASADHVIQATHGGGYVVGSRYSHRKLFGHIAKATGVRVLIVDYRRAPEHLHPAPVEDAVTTYRWLIEVWPEQQHVFQFLAGTAPEGDDAVAKLATWFRGRFGLNAAAA